MANRQPIQLYEWYHCFNRGVDKRRVFLEERDYERLLLLMYLSKFEGCVELFSERNICFEAILKEINHASRRPIVEIGVYALMPTHFHFVLKEIIEGGISLFMQKVFTGYTMYFNRKYERTGALFAGTFKSKHVADDRYLKHLTSYVHLNPGELFDTKWKEKRSITLAVENGLKKYPYSSLAEFMGIVRPHNVLIDHSIFALFDSKPSLRRMIQEAKIYENLNV